jgi:hypothetical protein
MAPHRAHPRWRASLPTTGAPFPRGIQSCATRRHTNQAARRAAPISFHRNPPVIPAQMLCRSWQTTSAHRCQPHRTPLIPAIPPPYILNKSRSRFVNRQFLPQCMDSPGNQSIFPPSSDQNVRISESAAPIYIGASTCPDSRGRRGGPVQEDFTKGQPFDRSPDRRGSN